MMARKRISNELLAANEEFLKTLMKASDLRNYSQRDFHGRLNAALDDVQSAMNKLRPLL